MAIEYWKCTLSEKDCNDNKRNGWYGGEEGIANGSERKSFFCVRTSMNVIEL